MAAVPQTRTTLHSLAFLVSCKRFVAPLGKMGGLSSLETAAGRFMDRPSLRKVNTRAPQVDGVRLSVPEVATDEEGPSPINFV